MSGSLCWLAATRAKILCRDLRNYATGKFNEAPPGQEFNRSVVTLKSAGKRQDCGHDAQAVIGLGHCQATWNPRALAAREHQRRMRRDAKERSMIPAGIETTHVEIPMIIRDDQH